VRPQAARTVDGVGLHSQPEGAGRASAAGSMLVDTGCAVCRTAHPSRTSRAGPSTGASVLTCRVDAGELHSLYAARGRRPCAGRPSARGCSAAYSRHQLCTNRRCQRCNEGAGRSDGDPPIATLALRWICAAIPPEPSAQHRRPQRSRRP